MLHTNIHTSKPYLHLLIFYKFITNIISSIFDLVKSKYWRLCRNIELQLFTLSKTIDSFYLLSEFNLNNFDKISLQPDAFTVNVPLQRLNENEPFIHFNRDAETIKNNLIFHLFSPLPQSRSDANIFTIPATKSPGSRNFKIQTYHS